MAVKRTVNWRRLSIVDEPNQYTDEGRVEGANKQFEVEGVETDNIAAGKMQKDRKASLQSRAARRRLLNDHSTGTQRHNGSLPVYWQLDALGIPRSHA